MKAAVCNRFGSPDVVELRDVDKSTPADDELLVRVRAASVNPADWYSVTGRPWVARPLMGLFKPREHRLGVDFAATVEEVGKDVTQFRPGDDVFGGGVVVVSATTVVEASFVGSVTFASGADSTG